MRRSVSVKFGKYFVMLLKVWRKAIVHDPSPLSLYHKVSIVSKKVILASNILSCTNIESSWKFFFTYELFE